MPFSVLRSTYHALFMISSVLHILHSKILKHEILPFSVLRSTYHALFRDAHFLH
jgi:hypothetical protein